MTDAESDPYQVLGVSPQATIDDLKRAYRRRALECHPDRGGSHMQMIELIAAWEILSDPIRRAHYDAARTHPSDQVSQETARNEAKEAEKRATEYPKTWSEFENWQSDVIGDFGKAQYSITWFLFIPFPVVAEKNTSISAWIFATLGSILALWWLPAPLYTWFRSSFDQTQWWSWASTYILPWMIPLYVGFSLGTIIHAGVTRLLSVVMDTSASRPPAPDYVPPADNVHILPCLQCGQLLRFPRAGRIKVNCPKCGFQSVHN